MRKLTKGPKPQVLIDNEEQWKRDLMQAVLADDKDEITKKTKRYNHKQVKDALIKETHGKCAYCESYVRHVAHGDIEHIFPKSKDRAKTFEWDNLTFACQICNQKKSNAEGIIDPYVDDLEEHLFFVSTFVRSITTKGAISIDKTSGLDLNRADLLERRHTQISRYADADERIVQEQDPARRQLLMRNFEADLSAPKTEYSAILKALRFKSLEAR
ncbi:MAG: HNH endonuclease [Planktomarina sp.]